MGIAHPGLQLVRGRAKSGRRTYGDTVHVRETMARTFCGRRALPGEHRPPIGGRLCRPCETALRRHRRVYHDEA